MSSSTRNSTDAGNLEFVVADAQTDNLGDDFDIVISRFGVMFFSDPDVAFANIGRAVRPGGRLAFPVWQHRERNAGAGLPNAVLGPQWRPDPSDPDPFSLAEKANTSAYLDAAGFVDVEFESVDEPVWYGDDLDVAAEFVSGFPQVRAAIKNVDDPVEARATVRRIVSDYHSPTDGVRFDAAAWIERTHKASDPL